MKNRSEFMKEQWKNPNSIFRSIKTSNNRSKAQRDRWKERPEEVERQREIMKNGWADHMNTSNHTEELRENHSKYMLDKWQDPSSKYNTEKYKETKRQQLLSGQGAWMHSLKKNPSKPQIEIFKMVQKVCPYVELNFPVYLENNYSIDIAVPKLNLAIEYDGYYWHQDDDYENKRKEELEEDGWKIIKYKGLRGKDVIPSLDQLKEDIKKVLNL